MNLPATCSSNSLVLGPHCHVVVQVVGKMVWHQVFPWDTDVHGVPVLKLPPQFLQMVFRNIRLGEWRSLKKDEVPDLFGHLLRPVRSKTGQRAPLTSWRLMCPAHDHASVWFYLVEKGWLFSITTSLMLHPHQNSLNFKQHHHLSLCISAEPRMNHHSDFWHGCSIGSTKGAMLS